MHARKTQPGLFNPQADPPAAVFGLTRKQTARISIFNLHKHGSPVIKVGFTFLDTEGSVLAQSTQSVEGEKAAWFDLNGAGWPATEPDRRQVIGFIRLHEPPEPDGAAVPIVASVEVFDNDGVDAGKTRIYEDITNYPDSGSDQSKAPGTKNK